MDSDSIYIGFVTKKEILSYLDQYGLRTEENLRPLENLRDSQCLKSDLLEFYQELFDSCENKHETTLIDDENDSLDFEYSDNENSETFNDTLAEMEAFMSNGPDYELEEVLPLDTKNESFFCPPISSTNCNENEHSIKNISEVFAPENSPVSDLGYFASNSNSASENSKSSNCIRNISNLTPKSSNSPKISDIRLEKLNLETLEKRNKSISPKNILKPKKTPELSGKRNFCTPKTLKENANPVFKTPLLPKTRTPSFKNIVSPISRYISETPTVPLVQKFVLKTVPFSEHNFKTPKKFSKVFTELPEVFYKPSRKQQITYEVRSSPLPKNINKYISKPLRPEIIKHKGRINFQNEFEEFLESYPIDVKVEDLSTFIDLETSRITEMSVIVSAEAKFSSK